MKNILTLLLSAGLVATATQAFSSPEEDLEKFLLYYEQRFPGVQLDDFGNGPYALDTNKRLQWESMEEFPPYEEYVDKGREIWETPFNNGKSFASCFGKDPSKVRVKYPHWDSNTQQVVTLEGDINKCLKDNGEKPFGWKKGKIAHLGAFLGYEARGQRINVVIPDDPKALEAYEEGKHFYYAKRGQLNLACADCHVQYPGHRVRGQLLSTGLGQTTHFPVFRAKWQKAAANGDGMGTLHRRYGGCNKQVRARPFKAQSRQYRNLEFFHTYMSNGLAINAPGYRE
ncbi:sulfur oxidation c-type cytochrome SoxA [Thiolapillus sp.]